MEDRAFGDQSLSFWRIQATRVSGPPKIDLLFRIPPTHFVPAARPGPFIFLYPSSGPPPHAAMIFPTLCFLSAAPSPPRPPPSHPRMGLTYSSAHRYPALRLTQPPCLSVPCAVSRPASLASIANSNSASTISMPAPTAATSIVVLALTLTTPMVIGPTLIPPSNSPPRIAQVAHRLVIGPILTLAAARGVVRAPSVNSPDLLRSELAASHRVARSSSVDLRRSCLAASNHQASWFAIPVTLKSLLFFVVQLVTRTAKCRMLPSVALSSPIALLSQYFTRLTTLIGFMFAT